MIWFALLLAICALALRTSMGFADKALHRLISMVGNLLAASALILGLLSSLAVVSAGHVGVAAVFVTGAAPAWRTGDFRKLDRVPPACSYTAESGRYAAPGCRCGTA